MALCRSECMNSGNEKIIRPIIHLCINAANRQLHMGKYQDFVGILLDLIVEGDLIVDRNYRVEIDIHFY